MKLPISLTVASYLVSSLFLSSSAFAGNTQRIKDEVTTIAVGPKADADSSPSADPNITTPASSGDDSSKSDSVSKSPAPAKGDEKAAEKAKEKSEDKHEKKHAAKVAKAKEEVSADKKDAGKSEKPEAAAKKPNAEGVTADQSLQWLINGNTRFMEKNFRADGRSEKDRARIAKEQKPHAIILSCSDSRVPPELIFDQGLGEITTIRVAGEVLDSSVIASIEQTLINEHPHLLVVLGHTQCESIESALGWRERATDGSDALDRLTAEIKPHLKSLTPGAASPGLQVEAALQADGVARDLKERSEIIKKAVESGALTIKTGLYWIDTGQVKFY